MQPELEKYKSVLRSEMPRLASRFNVDSLGLFGSFVRQENTPISDLDVLVSFSEPPGLIRYLELENYLTDLLGIEVDLVMSARF